MFIFNQSCINLAIGCHDSCVNNHIQNWIGNYFTTTYAVIILHLNPRLQCRTYITKAFHLHPYMPAPYIDILNLSQLLHISSKIPEIMFPKPDSQNHTSRSISCRCMTFGYCLIKKLFLGNKWPLALPVERSRHFWYHHPVVRSPLLSNPLPPVP